MDWVSIGGRIRRQREFLGYTREQLLRSCSSSEQAYAEQLLKTFIMAMNAKKESL